MFDVMHSNTKVCFVDTVLRSEDSVSEVACFIMLLYCIVLLSPSRMFCFLSHLLAFLVDNISQKLRVRVQWSLVGS